MWQWPCNSSWVKHKHCEVEGRSVSRWKGVNRLWLRQSKNWQRPLLQFLQLRSSIAKRRRGTTMTESILAMATFKSHLFLDQVQQDHSWYNYFFYPTQVPHIPTPFLFYLESFLISLITSSLILSAAFLTLIESNLDTPFFTNLPSLIHQY